MTNHISCKSHSAISQHIIKHFVISGSLMCFNYAILKLSKSQTHKTKSHCAYKNITSIKISGPFLIHCFKFGYWSKFVKVKFTKFLCYFKSAFESLSSIFNYFRLHYNLRLKIILLF